MRLFKFVIIGLFLGVMMLVAKPFIGFKSFKRLHHIKHISICVKAFTKRKQEFVEGGSFDIITIQKKLADPAKSLLLGLSILLNIILPFCLETVNNLTDSFLRKLRWGNYTLIHSYLLNGNLLI